MKICRENKLDESSNTTIIEEQNIINNNITVENSGDNINSNNINSNNTNSNNINTINTINNINNNINLSNQNIIQFPLAPFDQPDTSKLTIDDMSKALGRGRNAYIELHHILQTNPTNLNIIPYDVKTKYFRVYNGKNWVDRDKTSVIDTRIDSISKIMTDIRYDYPSVEKKLNNKIINSLNILEDNIDNKNLDEYIDTYSKICENLFDTKDNSRDYYRKYKNIIREAKKKKLNVETFPKKKEKIKQTANEYDKMVENLKKTNIEEYNRKYNSELINYSDSD
jgi:hypothetical protein